MISENYINKIYGGVYGKLVGVRLGIPFENQKADDIQRRFPHITGYVSESTVFNEKEDDNCEKLMHPDDDTNGFAFFIKIFQKINSVSEITPKLVAHTILNIAAENRGFFWWQEDFAESGAFHNLLQGISPLKCGDAKHIGKACHHVGGQIFYDAIGLIFAGRPEIAAHCAGIVSSVMHRGEGALGGQFICACISAAFQKSNLYEIIETGLSFIPQSSNYARAVRDIMNFYQKNPYDWKACLCHIEEHYYTNMIWDYTAVIIMSLLYGNGNFSRSMEICIHCGGDTDGSCGNLGTILGVLGGIETIFYPKWIAPMNDVLYCSSTLPGENEVSITQLTAQIIELCCKFNGFICPKYIEQAAQLNNYSFAFPYSYQNIQAHLFRDNVWMPELVNRMNSLWVTSGEVNTPSGSPYSLKFWSESVYEKDCYRVCRWFSHNITEFNSLKYEPTLCQRLYPGQTVGINIMTLDSQFDMKVCLMIYSTENGEELRSNYQSLAKGVWKRLTLKLPNLKRNFYNCVNIEIIPENQPLSVLKNGFSVYFDDFKVEGTPFYEIEIKENMIKRAHYPVVDDFAVCYNTDTFPLLRQDELLTIYDMRWNKLINHKYLTMMFTGSTDLRNYTAKCRFFGCVEIFLMDIAVQGVLEHYAAGIYNEEIAILKSGRFPGEYIVLCSKKYENVKSPLPYLYEITVYNKHIIFSITNDNKTETLIYQSSDSLRGCIGFSNIGHEYAKIISYGISPVNQQHRNLVDNNR